MASADAWVRAAIRGCPDHPPLPVRVRDGLRAQLDEVARRHRAELGSKEIGAPGKLFESRRASAEADLAQVEQFGHNGHMRKTSLAEAKAHLSALVDEAEHRHNRILILRHGKPAAAIVPVDVAFPPQHRLSRAEIEQLFAGLGSAEPRASAVDDLLSGRR
jgi:prevent-host-death family protein